MKFGLGLGINQRAENLEGMGGFDISNVSGLQRWYKFQTGITLNGSNVSKWDDQSGNNVHLTQSTATQQPSYNSGNLGFDRVNDKMSMDSNIALTTFTIFMVISTDTTSSNNQTLLVVLYLTVKTSLGMTLLYGDLDLVVVLLVSKL